MNSADSAAISVPRARRRLGAIESLWSLTTVAVWIEVGLCVHLLSTGKALWQIAITLAAFHVGYLVARGPVSSLVLTRGRAITGVGLAVSVVGIIWSPALLGAGIAVLSSGLQSWRRRLKITAKVATGRKNVGKAIGMASAGVFALPTPVCAAVVMLVTATIIAFCELPDPSGGPINATDGDQDHLLLLAEALHHAHYFSYVYVFWALTTVPAAWVAPAFLLGWIGYFIAEALLTQPTRRVKPVAFAVGHVICAVALLGMSETRSTLAILALWTITGIGGGTAYMLGGLSTRGNREAYEDSGHVAGCLLCAAVVGASGSATGATLTGAALAMAAAMAFTLHITAKNGTSA
jgi:hypothetical protein